MIKHKEKLGKKIIYIVLLSLLQIVLNIGSVGYAIVFKGLTDAAVGSNRNSFITWIVAFAALALFQITIGAINRFLTEYSRASLENCFKERLFSNILGRRYADSTAVHSGEWMNRLTSDTTVVADGLTQIIPGFLGMAVKLVGVFVLLLILCPVLVAILIPGGALIGVFAGIFRKPLKLRHKRVQEADGRVRVFLQEALSGLLVVKAFCGEDRAVADAGKYMKEHKAARIRRSNLSNICTVGFNGAMNAAYVAGAALGGYGIITGTMTYGTLMAIIQLVGQLQAPFSTITSYFPQYYAMLASVERLMEVENFEPDIAEDKLLTSEQILEVYGNRLESIRFENISFGYSDGQRVFENVNFSVKKGDYVAFTGHSGCGKSTLLKLLMSLYIPDEGYIAFCLKGNVIWSDSSKYRRMFAYVPQGNMLMSGTIRDVISFSHTAATVLEEQIWQALSVAAAADFVRELPLQLDTMLGERGAGLSEGQMQRIAIARAVYSGAPVLLLDEATSALDEETERAVLRNLRTMTDKTVLFVTHRRAALDICDMEVHFSESRVEIAELKKHADWFDFMECDVHGEHMNI